MDLLTCLHAQVIRAECELGIILAELRSSADSSLAVALACDERVRKADRLYDAALFLYEGALTVESTPKMLYFTEAWMTESCFRRSRA